MGKSGQKVRFGARGFTILLLAAALVPACVKPDAKTSKKITSLSDDGQSSSGGGGGNGGTSEGGGGSTGPTTCAAATTGTPWVPNVPGASDANHTDTNATIGAKTFPVARQTKTVHVTAANASPSEANQGDGFPSIATFQIDMPDDLLQRGSLTLVAEPINPSPVMQTDMNNGFSIYPLLFSLTDPAGNEYVRLTAGCSTGFYTCTNGANCTLNAACGIQAGSAFLGTTDAQRLDKWKQHQGYLSDLMVGTNSFPSCNWATAPAGTPACPFASAAAAGNPFFLNGKLRTGTWTAKYMIGSDHALTTNGSAAFADRRADVRLSVIRKRDGDNGVASRGAVDLNVILVGASNVRDSRTAKGKQNLDALFTHVLNHYNQSSTQIKIGKISAYEWCDQGGEAFANVNIDATGTLFKTGSALMPPASETKAVNVFLTTTIAFGGAGTILGRSGGITGAVINGTMGSGAVFATQGDLDTHNPACTPGNCPVANQEDEFIDMGGTISHELGHFLGLNHLSESTGTFHDRLPDTPICTATNNAFNPPIIYLDSCRTADTNAHATLGGTCNATCTGANLAGPGCGASYNGSTCFCPAVQQCQFNHVMWWTTKGFGPNGSGDGQLFSGQSGDVLNYSAFVQ